MKTKLTLTLLALLALMLTGCEDNRTQSQKDSDAAAYITEINYKGHKYLLYQQRAGYAGYGGITHDPDCPCREKGGEMNKPRPIVTEQERVVCRLAQNKTESI